MNYALTAAYLPCQACTARANCKECERRLEDAMLRINGIPKVSFNAAKKELLVDADMDEDQLAEYLEDLSLFVD